MNEAASSVLLPAHGRVVAIAVGLEHYQGARFSAVDFASADAREFVELLPNIYGDRVDSELFVDSDATKTTLDYQIGQAVQAANVDDLFLFFYAGHGFFGAGDNRLTAFDTGTANILETSVSLYETLLKPLSESACRRALLFIDACATQTDGRLPISSFDREAIGLPDGDTDEYHAVFLSCSRGQSSYSSPALRHGIWTYHLLRALRGEDKAAFANGNAITDVSLRDYLRESVPRYVRESTTMRSRQVPEAIIRATSTFRIREFPRAAPVVAVQDLSVLSAPLQDAYFEGVTDGAINRLSGFKRGSYTVPKSISGATSRFVKDIAWPEVDNDLQSLYQQTKDAFSLRHKDIARAESHADASGSIDCEYFRYSVQAEQDPDDAGMYRITRRLTLRDTDEDIVEACDVIFSRRIDYLVLEVDARKWNYAELVSRFEDFQEAHGGDLDEDESEGVIRYTADGATIEVSTVGRIILSTPRSSIEQMLARARAITFGLTGANTLALR